MECKSWAQWIRELIEIGEEIMKTGVNSFFSRPENECALSLTDLSKKILISTQNLSAGETKGDKRRRHHKHMYTSVKGICNSDRKSVV